MLDLEQQELLVEKGFWGLLGGENIYENLLNIFEGVEAGLKDEINNKIGRLGRT